MINSIGFNIPHVFHNVTKLYLSNNRIRYIKGIEVFKNLVFFSVAFNEIDNIEELDRLFNKNAIISLSVKGNLFNKNPSANIIIIKKFPNLKDLDGYKVSNGTIITIEGNLINFHNFKHLLLIYLCLTNINRFKKDKM